MKKIVIAVLIVLIAGYCAYSGYLMFRNNRLVNTEGQRVVLAYNKSSLRNHSNILKAYERVLIKENISFKKVEVHTLMKLDVKKMLRNTPAIIFPDGLVQHMPEELTRWVKEYLAGSGNIAVIYDVGVKNSRGYYLGKSVFADFVGINYITYQMFEQNAYATGSLQFVSAKEADYFQIPPAQISVDGFLVKFPYGKIYFPAARCEFIKPIPEKDIFAHIVIQKGEKYPAILIRKYRQSNILYANIPLGYLNARSGDFLLEKVLVAFLTKTLSIEKI